MKKFSNNNGRGYKIYYLALLTAILLLVARGQTLMAQEERYVPETDPLVLQKLEAWQDLKFGLLMHWGPYSQWGIVES